ncbi:MAG TPA: PhnD/SsuA/transferrin family substrate-binding protein [Gaiellales bacterium]|jgi:phosphonate transport system substrate-binding protein
MTPLAVHSFLGEAARPHYEAVAAELARVTGVALEPLRETRLAELPNVVSGAPALLFVCGLPYARSRDAGGSIEALAAPVPDDEDAAVYRADLLTAPGSELTAPEQLRGRRVGFNGDDSLSGWVMPRHALRGLGIDPDDYDWVVTGSHRNSLRALARGEIEAAPIDSTLRTLELRADPSLGALARIARLGRMPSPPVALVGGDEGLARTLRAALAALHEAEAGRAALALGAVQRFDAIADADYAPVRAADATR